MSQNDHKTTQASPALKAKLLLKFFAEMFAVFYPMENQYWTLNEEEHLFTLEQNYKPVPLSELSPS